MDALSSHLRYPTNAEPVQGGLTIGPPGRMAPWDNDQGHLLQFGLLHQNGCMRTARNTRKYPRLPLAFPVFVHAKGQDGSQFLEFATVLNVSAGGVLVLLRKIPPTKHVSMEIPLTPGLTPESGEAIRFLKAKIVRSEPREQCTLVGMQFDHPLGHA